MTHSFPKRRSSDLDRADGRRDRLLGEAVAEVAAIHPYRRGIELGQAGGLVSRRFLGVVPGARDQHGGHQGNAHRDRKEDRKEHTSELQSLMRISYAVFCLKKKKTHKTTHIR